MTDVLLINSSFTYGRVARGIQYYPPIGLNYLAASLRLEGMNPRIIDLGIEPLTVEKINEVIAAENIPLVGISSNSPQIHITMRIINGMRQRFGDKLTIALGGFHISNDPTFLERYPQVDIGVVGDGDITFTKLAKRVLGGEKVRGTFNGEMTASLDDMPFPAYDLTPLEAYKEAGLQYYPLLGTRGCPFNCVFCSRSPMSRKVRFRSAENLLEEMKQGYDIFGGRYGFLDESFTLRERNVVEFCEGLMRWGKQVRWSAGGIRLDQINPDVLDLMWKAGCRDFFVGVETGSERVRREIVGKRISDKQIFESFKILDRHPFEVEASFVLGHPTETEQELAQTCFFPAKLKSMGVKCLTQVGFKLAVPLPGSRLWKIALEEGKVPPDFIDRYINFEYGEDFFSVWPKYYPDGISKERVLELKKQGYLKYYLRPEYILARLKRDLLNPKYLLQDLREFLSMIRKGHSTVSLTE